MPQYGQSSRSKLHTCHRDIQTNMNVLILYFDNTVIFGHRTPEEQFELFKKGRKFIGRPGEEQNANKWIIENKREIVTHKDGYIKLSRHNKYPSEAIDIAPWPLNWNKKNRFYYQAGIVQWVSHKLYAEGKTEHVLKWGADWDMDHDFDDHDFVDLPHFQLHKPG